MNVSSSTIGHDFSNKVIQKLTLEKNVFKKKWSPKLIFTNDFFQFRKSLTSKIDLESMILSLFVELSSIDRIFFFL